MKSPSPSVIAARERDRHKAAYERWEIGELDTALRKHTPRLGLWLDTSGHAPEDTVDEILGRAWSEALV